MPDVTIMYKFFKKEQIVSKNNEIAMSELCRKIYTIRGQKVILDRDLAEIYGYSTRAFNQQVLRNIKKFEGEDFMFQLSREEMDFLVKSQIVISRDTSFFAGQGGGVRKLPYAFTESGIYMVMTVLKGELATRQSRLLIRTFRAMKDYILENKLLLDHREDLSIADKILDNADQIATAKEKIRKIDIKVSQLASEMDEVVKKSEVSPVFLDFNKLDEHKEFLFLNDEPIRAKEAYMEIYKCAKQRIYIVDNYINIKTLHLLQMVKRNMEITIYTDNTRNYLRKNDLEDFLKERPDLKIKFIKTKGKFHDRFIILDEKIFYQSGGSSKDLGNKISSIHEIAEDFIKNSLLTEINKFNSELRLK